MLIVDLSLARVVQHCHLSSQFVPVQVRVVSQIDHVQCRRMRMRMTTITVHIQNLTLSSLK